MPNGQVYNGDSLSAILFYHILDREAGGMESQRGRAFHKNCLKQICRA